MSSQIGNVFDGNLELGLELEPLRFSVGTIDGSPATCVIEFACLSLASLTLSYSWRLNDNHFVNGIILALCLDKPCFFHEFMVKTHFFVWRSIMGAGGLQSSLNLCRFSLGWLQFIHFVSILVPIRLHQQLCLAFAIVFEWIFALEQTDWVLYHVLLAGPCAIRSWSF